MRWLFAAIVCLFSFRGVEAGSPAAATTAGRIYVQRLNPKNASYTRLLYIGHVEARFRQRWWQVISAHVNGLSREDRIVRPLLVLEDGTVRDGLTLVGKQDPDPIKEAEWNKAILISLNIFAYGNDFKFWPVVWEKLPTPHFRVLISKEVYQDGGKAHQEWGYFVRRSDGRPVETTYEKSKDDPTLRWVVTERRPVAAKARKQDFFASNAPWIPVADYAILSKLTHSEVPIVYADWFYWQTAIENDREPAGYYDFLGVKDERTFHELIGFDDKVFLKQFNRFVQESRAAVAISGVLAQPRRIARYRKIGGALWATYDNRLATNRFVDGKAEFRDPLQVLGDEFKFDGTEQFAHLANGLWATYAGDAQGKRLNSAPDFLGYDKTSNRNTARIEVNLSCLRCHLSDGLQDLKPYHQNLYGNKKIKLLSPDLYQLAEAERLYFRRFDPALKADRAQYSEALLECNGMTGREYAVALSECWAEYDGNVTIARACRELGTTEKEFRPALQAYLSQLTGDQILANWLLDEKDQSPLVIDTWHSIYPLAQVALESYRAAARLGYKVPDLETPECEEWTKRRGRPPAYELDKKLLSWQEVNKASGFDPSKWACGPAVGSKVRPPKKVRIPDPLEKVERELGKR